MRLGALIGPATPDAPPRALPERARALEEAGFDGLWAFQALARPTFVPDPLLALAAAAAVTERVRLGTAVLQLPLYEPADLAHRLFSLRALAGDRLVLGVGAGSTASDFLACGRDFAGRFARFDACLAALRALLASGGDGRVALSPAPALLGAPPLYHGSWGKGVARAARDFDRWIASALHRGDEQVSRALAGYRAGGGRHAVVSSVFLGPGDAPGAHRARLEAFAAAGFDEAVVLMLPGGPSPHEVRGWVPPHRD